MKLVKKNFRSSCKPLAGAGWNYLVFASPLREPVRTI